MEARAKEFAGTAKNALREGRQAFKETAQTVAERTKAFGASAVESARGAYVTTQRKVARGARATDRVIRRNPYAAIGIALGVGLMIGFLARRRES